jgi:RNA polymerase sigma factor (sigma-70 family)
MALLWTELARNYEAGPEDRLDLLQEIHIVLWRSLAGFDGRCSLRTWVYRIAHNVAVSHILRSRKARSLGLLSFEELEETERPGVSDSDMRPLESQQLTPPLSCQQPTDRAYQKRTKYRLIYRPFRLLALSNLFGVNSRWVDADRLPLS